MNEHRLIGPPGTGKTWTLTQYAERGAELYGADGVYIGSLTKAAAQEIAGRAKAVPKQNVGTLHALAFRALEHPALAEIPEALVDWNRSIENTAPTLQIRVGSGLDDQLDYQGDALANSATEGEALLAELSTRRARMEDPAGWPPRLARFADLWGAWKKETQRHDFTDLIERATEELEELPGRPGVFLLDEAQDLSALEFALARKLGAKAQEFVVCGDPDQNLYAWRGADPDAFWAGSGASEKVIEESRRVPRAIVAYSLEWIERIQNRRPVVYGPRREDPDDPTSPVVEGEIRALDDPRGRPSYLHPQPLLTELYRDLERGRTVMVLASCGYMLEPLARELRQAGIPYHNPYRPKHGGWNPLRGASRPLAFLRPSSEVWGDEARAWTWEDLSAWAEPLEAKRVFTRGAKSVIEARNLPDRMRSTAGAEEAVPFSRLFADETGLLLAESRDPAVELDLAWWESNLLQRHAKKYAYPCRVARRQGAKALLEDPRLVLGTIHSVKGGEADSVYVFPDLSRAACPVAPAGGPPPLTDAIVRLFYVAFTRARESLTILDPAGAEYAALPRPGGGEVRGRPRGRALNQLLREDLAASSGTSSTIPGGRQATEEAA